MKIAVITGASSGLGVEFTKTIIKQYPKLDEIWIIARRKDRLKNLARHNPDKKIRAITLDLGADEEYSIRYPKYDFCQCKRIDYGTKNL